MKTQDYISYKNIINYYARLRLKQLNKRYRWLFNLPINTINFLGFDIRDGELGLIPIDIYRYCYCLSGKKCKHLVHDGFIRSADILEINNIKESIINFDNKRNMERFGVWGFPSQCKATYLRPDYSRVRPFERNGKGCRLIINVDVLNKLRDIYIDPEMYIPPGGKFLNGAHYDFPGYAVMVFGGIPIESIIKMEDIYIKEYVH